jgi:hypothetical protein
MGRVLSGNAESGRYQKHKNIFNCCPSAQPHDVLSLHFDALDPQDWPRASGWAGISEGRPDHGNHPTHSHLVSPKVPKLLSRQLTTYAVSCFFGVGFGTLILLCACIYCPPGPHCGGAHRVPAGSSKKIMRDKQTSSHPGV